MAEATERDVDVIIIGGGPVGTGLAIELAQRGIACAIVERYETPQLIPKGQNLTQRTMEHFQVWGCEDALRAARTIPPSYGIGGMTSWGTLFGAYRYDWLQREIVRPFYFCDNERLPQYATEAVLRARAYELDNVRLHYGMTAERVVQDATGVSVEIASSDGLRTTLHGRYVVGCDGARSTVREQSGITQTRADHDRMMVLLVFRSRGLNAALNRFPGKSFYCVLDPALEGYWKFFGRVDLDGQFFFHAPVPPGTTRDNFDFRAFLHEAAGETFDVALDHIGFWDLRFTLADTYRNGRIFIAGDAAHSHPPYGGYGINTGFEDARNLGWKLAATLQGWGHDHLLESYDRERRPVFESTARDFIVKAIETDRVFLAAFDPRQDKARFEAAWAARSSGTRSEVQSFEPNYEGSPVICDGAGAPSAVGSHDPRARAGHHICPQVLSDGANVFDRLGPDFTLLSFTGNRDTNAFALAAAAQKIPLTIVRDIASTARDRYGASMILVRPDHFVAWAGDIEGGDPRVILTQATGA